MLPTQKKTKPEILELDEISKIANRIKTYFTIETEGADNSNFYANITLECNPGKNIHKRGAFNVYRKEDKLLSNSLELDKYLLKYYKPYNKYKNDYIPISTDDSKKKQGVAILSTDSRVGNKTVYKTLIEIGTITNPLDAVILADKSNIKIFSEQLIKGLLEHIQNKFLL